MFKRIIILLSIVFSICQGINAQEFVVKHKSFIPIDFSAYKKENFKFLDSLLLDNETVLLGEGLHNFSDDTESKLMIIRFLHEELGYNLILFENSFYDYWDLNKSLGIVNGFDDTLSKYTLRSYFSKGKYDIIKYINDCKAKGDTIDIGGIDIWTTYDNELRHFLWFVTNNRRYINPKYVDLIITKENKRVELKSITSLPDSIINNMFVTEDLNKLWRRIYDNYKISYQYDIETQNYYKKHPNVKIRDSVIVSDDYRQRDSMMFANYQYLNNIYKTKSIVLISNFHVRKSLEPFLSNPLVGNNTIPFGSYFIKNNISSYHIASVSYKVENYKKNRIFIKYFKRDRNSFERYLRKKFGYDGFVELKEVKHIGDSTYIMYPVWRFKTKGDWKKAYDALIYLDKIKVSTTKVYSRKDKSVIYQDQKMD